jgi:mannose-6-phosphate isomerase-like protein (cupin superfamily)
MVFRNVEMEKVHQDKPRGGEGSQEVSFAFPMGKAPENTAFQVAAYQVLAPQSAIGFHEHEDNSDVYLIVSGKGVYTDEAKKEIPVGPGDITICCKGQGHALANPNDEPLVFFAVMAK